jgi:predicted nucleic acid-binding protein
MSISIPASEFVTDTMGLVLRIERRRLGPVARAIFDAVESGTATVYIPALVFAVTTYLEQFPSYKEFPMSLAVVQSAAEITDVPELHDRLIAGTARSLNLDLITNDPTIRASTFLKTVWD